MLHRILAASLTATLAFVVSLTAAVTPAFAADTWIREVRFPSEQSVGDEVLRWEQETIFCQTPGKADQYSTSDTMPVNWILPGGNGSGGGWQHSVNNYAGCDIQAYSPSAMVFRSVVEDAPTWAGFNSLTPLGSVDGGARVQFAGIWQGGFQFCGGPAAENQQLRFQQWSSTFGTGALLSNTTIVSTTSGVRCASGAFNIIEELHPDARTFGISGTAIDGMMISEGYVMVSTDLRLEGGSCRGATGAGTLPGLTWPSGGLTSSTHPDGWGDQYHMVEEACELTTPGLFRYTPPEGMTEGETHTVGVQVAAPDGTCRVLIQIAGSGPTVNALSFTYSGDNPGGATGPGHKILKVNAPAGATHFTIYLSDRCWLQGLYLGNVEGDPVLDDGSNGTGGPGPPNPGEAWDDCQPGSDFLAVGEWVAYAACLIAGLPIAIGIIIAGILTDLFVPSSLAAQWSSFLAFLNTKIPFVWIGESIAFATSMLTAGNLAGPSIATTMNIMGAPVVVNFGSVFGPLADFRPYLVGLVAIGTGVAIFRTVQVGREPKQLSMSL